MDDVIPEGIRDQIRQSLAVDQLHQVLRAHLCRRKLYALLNDRRRVLLLAELVDVSLQELENGLAHGRRPPRDDLCDRVVSEGVTHNLERVLRDLRHDVALLLRVSRTRDDDLHYAEAISVLAEVSDAIFDLAEDKVKNVNERFRGLFRLVDQFLDNMGTLLILKFRNARELRKNDLPSRVN